MLISTNLHKKSREVSIKTRSPPASFTFKGRATKHTTVKWSIPVEIIVAIVSAVVRVRPDKFRLERDSNTDLCNTGAVLH